MSYDQAAKIAHDCLHVLKILYEKEPLRLSTSTECEETKIKTFHFLPNKMIVYFDSRSNDEEYHLDILYQVIYENRCFEITLLNDPDDCGYYSELDYFNSSTYVLCEIVEKRPNGEKKYEMTFGFDIQKKTFLELFDIVHYNTQNMIRVYITSPTSRLEKNLKNVVIL